MTIARRTAVLTCSFEDNGLMPEAVELSDNPLQAAPRIASWISGLAAGAQVGSLSMLVDDGDGVAATGTVTVSGAAHGTFAVGSYTLSGVGGTAASGTVTLGGGAGNVTIVTDGTSVGPVAFNTSDAQTATDCITALNANGTFAAKATASSGGSGVILITWNTKGTVGNSKTLTASRTAGTATASGATLSGGAQGAVTVGINGTTVGPVDTTNLDDDDSATAVAAAIEANGTLGPLLAAVGSGPDVGLTWGTQGTVGNVPLAVGVSATGTATRSGATMINGTDTSVTVTINGAGVSVNTTTTTTDAEVATAIKTTVNASVNPLVDGVVTASNPTSTTALLTADTKGPSGNWITLAVSGTGLTASGTRLSGGSAATDTATLER